MSADTLNPLIGALFGVIFLLLGLVLVVSSIGATKPYEQIAFANTERLAAAINEVCLTGRDSDNPIEVDFSLPQTNPFGSSVSDFLPALRIRNDGDPMFVLYYEMFPPGEATSWEVYDDLGYRAIAPIKGGETVSLDDIETYIDEARSQVQNEYQNENPSPTVVDVLVNNIILNSYLDPTSGSTGKDLMGELVGSKFALSGLWQQTAVNKTNLKYLVCGDNALCLKTRSGIYKFPLTECEKAGIDYLQLIVPGQRWVDFYSASPCTTTFTIFQEDCANSPWGGRFNPLGGSRKYYCENKASYPIYEYNSAAKSLQIANKGNAEHITCLDFLGGDVSSVCDTGHCNGDDDCDDDEYCNLASCECESASSAQEGGLDTGGMKCVRIGINAKGFQWSDIIRIPLGLSKSTGTPDKEGFCYTNNPYKGLRFRMTNPTRPVTDSTTYMDNKFMIIPLQSLIKEGSSKFMKTLLGRAWRWPLSSTEEQIVI